MHFTFVGKDGGGQGDGMSEHCFNLVIKGSEKRDAWVEIRMDVYESFGTSGRIKVKVSFDGYSCRGSLIPWQDIHKLRLTMTVQDIIGKSIGDTVYVALEQEEYPQMIKFPDEVMRALEAHPEIRLFFNSLSNKDRKNYAAWIAKGKKPETRKHRIRLAIEKLSRGETLL
jgi:hypothetical protein